MIRLLIADDHALVRQGLRQVVASTTDITVEAEADNGLVKDTCAFLSQRLQRLAGGTDKRRQERNRTDLEAGCLEARQEFADNGANRQHDGRLLGAGAAEQA